MTGCTRCGHDEGGEKQSVKRTARDWKCLRQAHGKAAGKSRVLWSSNNHGTVQT